MKDETTNRKQLEELEGLREKVEAQDRELSIQNALERVRARALGMRKSPLAPL